MQERTMTEIIMGMIDDAAAVDGKIRVAHTSEMDKYTFWRHLALRHYGTDFLSRKDHAEDHRNRAAQLDHYHAEKPKGKSQ